MLGGMTEKKPRNEADKKPSARSPASEAETRASHESQESAGRERAPARGDVRMIRRARLKSGQ